MSLNRKQQIDYTQRYQIRSGRVNFVDYVQRKQLINEARLLGINLYPPDLDSSIIPIIQEGETNTTPEELERYLAEVALPKPAIPTPPIPPTSGGSMVFDYTVSPNGSHVSYPNDVNLCIGSQNFTIEWYQYWQAGADFPRVFSIGSFADSDVDIAVSYEEFFFLWINGSAFAVSSNPPQDTWVHIAIVGSSGNVIKIYQNGSQIGERLDSYNFTDNTTNLMIGNETNPTADGNFTGKITNFRWVVGTAVYTGNFTPPTIPLSDIPGTQLLLLASNETNVVADSSSVNRTPTNTDIVFSTDQPS